MTRLLALALAGLCGCGSMNASSTDLPPPHRAASVVADETGPAEVLVRDIAVYSPSTGRFALHQDIVVRGTRIAWVGPTGGSVPAAKTTVLGTGKFAIPGLFDNHVHLTRLTPRTAGLFLAFGVTSVRDMGTDLRLVSEWRKSIDYGKFLGPRIVRSCGPMLESGGAQRPDHWIVAGPREADSVVGELASQGAECVKIRTYKDSATYVAIARAASRRNLTLAGHAPEALPPLVALTAGQRSFEHGFYPYPLSKLDTTARAIFFSAFRSAKAAQIPTLIAWKPATMSSTALEELIGAARREQRFSLPAELLAHWETGLETHRRGKRGSPGWISAVATASRDIGTMHHNGLTILPGSDTGAPFVVPGRGLLEELLLLNRDAGMSAADVLTSATLRSAEFNGRLADLGSIEAGKIADMVILNVNPLLDLDFGAAIDGVVFRGEMLTRAHLNMLLSSTLEPPRGP